VIGFTKAMDEEKAKEGTEVPAAVTEQPAYVGNCSNSCSDSLSGGIADLKRFPDIAADALSVIHASLAIVKAYYSIIKKGKLKTGLKNALTAGKAFVEETKAFIKTYTEQLNIILMCLHLQEVVVLSAHKPDEKGEHVTGALPVNENMMQVAVDAILTKAGTLLNKTKDVSEKVYNITRNREQKKLAVIRPLMGPLSSLFKSVGPYQALNKAHGLMGEKLRKVAGLGGF